MKPDILATFKVRPEPKQSRLFYYVRVFRSERALRRYLSRSPFPRVLGRYGRAMCSSFDAIKVLEDGREYKTPEMGEILIPKARLGSEVISHECTHAALGWAQRIKLDPMTKPSRSQSGILAASSAEERFCYGLGQMVRQLIAHGYRLKLFPRDK